MTTATTTMRQRIFLWAAPSVITLGLLAFAVLGASDLAWERPFWVIAVPGAVLVMFLVWFSYLSIPRRVVVDDGVGF